jgi:acetoacetyl-CoA synthetase
MRLKWNKMMDARVWEPTRVEIERSNLTKFIRRIENRRGLTFADYHDFYAWSVKECEMFWREVWDFCEVRASRHFDCVLKDEERMPGATWFPGSRLNFAENLLRYDDERPAIIFWGEEAVRQQLTFKELRRQVACVAAELREMGLAIGDRVVGLLPNIPQAIVAMLATTSLGAVWASCSPDFGVPGIVDRFGQISPKVIFTADDCRFKGATIDLISKAQTVIAQLPSLRHAIVVADRRARADCEAAGTKWHRFSDLISHPTCPPINFVQSAFDHPLYVMFSSGTTGQPKCIVHSAGGTLIEHLKELVLHTDLRRDDRIFYATTCGWMMWNWLVSSLAVGATVLLYDGSPSMRHLQILFDFAETEAMTVFGTSAAFISAIRKAGLRPAQTHRLERLRTILSTGSPLVPECFDYVYEHVKPDVQLSSISGGTDIIGCFALGCPNIPVHRGELQTRSLGYAVEVFDETGRPTVGQNGELVCTAPFPSMPIGFWNDSDGRLYRDAYFSRFVGVWCHGDYVCLTETGGLVFYGRSDAVLNPCGVRIGTAEIYRQLEAIEAVESSVVVGQEWNGDTRIVLFVKLRPGHELDADLCNHIKTQIRERASPRHVPKKIVQVDDIPVTRSGKISELAVKNIVHGIPVSNYTALANPGSLACFQNRTELLN